MRTLPLVSLLLLTLAAPAAAEPVLLSPARQATDRERAPRDQAAGAGQPQLALRRHFVQKTPLEQQPLADPARTRLLLNRSADLLGQGELEFVCRELLGIQLALGVSDWLELGFTSTPLLAMIPLIGLQGSYWSGDLRLQLVDRPSFSLAAELSGLSFLRHAGFRAGLAARLGNDRFAVHGNASAGRLWSTADEECSQDAGCFADPPQALLLAGGGLTVRLARKVKLLFEATYYRGSELDAILGSPAVRLHGRHFAADLGLLLVRTAVSDELLVLPLVNLSVTY